MSEHNRETWLQSIRSNPSDWQAMLVFADWLEESGDLLAAEQWRWIAVVSGYNQGGKVPLAWPRVITSEDLHGFEQDFAQRNSIRCMPTYPLTIEDVQAYLGLMPVSH